MITVALLALVLGAQAAHDSPAESSKATLGLVSPVQVESAALDAWKAGRDDEALRLCNEGLKLQPTWDDGLWCLGTIAYQRSDYLEARDRLRHYLARNPNRGVGWALVGLSDYELHEYVHADEDLRRALTVGMEGRKELAGQVYYFSALLLTRQERFEESAAYLYHLRRHDAGLQIDAPLETPMGLNALKYAMLPEEIPPDRVDLVRQTGAAVFARYEERRDEAKNILSSLLKQYPDVEALHFQYGLILLEAHSAEGVAEMESAMKLSPSDPEPHMLLAQYQMDLGRLDKARSLVDEALALAPDLLAARLLKGEILSASGDMQAAIAQFQTVHESTPGDTRAVWDLIRALKKTGRTEEAAQMTETLKKMDSGNDYPTK